jgi:putative DNA primase/helicase
MGAYERYREKIDAQLEPLASVHLVHGVNIKPEPISWLWDNWLARGKLHVLAGPPGTGKTTIGLALAATLTRGAFWPDGSKASPGTVLLWSGEDDPTDTLAPRLLAMGADMSRVYFVGAVGDGQDAVTFDPAKHSELLERAIADIGGIDMLIVDPIVSAVNRDSHKNAEVRRGLQPLVDLGIKMQAAILGISHFSKGTSGRDPVERVTGSIAFGALARLVFAAAKMPDNDQEGGSRLFCRSKSNLGPDTGGFRYDLKQVELPNYPGVFASALLWGKAEEGSARELLNRAEAMPNDDDGDEDETTPQEAWLFELLTNGPKPAKEVIAEGKEAGFTEKQIRTARERLGITPAKHGYQGAWSWSLPEGTFTPKEFKDAKDAHDSERCSTSKNEGTFGTFGSFDDDAEDF